MAELLKGAPVARALTEELGVRVAALLARGVTPGLAILRVGERPDDLSYERAALKRCEKVGIAVRRVALPADCTQAELERAIRDVNADPAVHGCLMFRPLPASLDERAACAALDVEAVIEVLDHYGYDLTGANVTVVGRSLVIGKPVSMMLQARNATVTMCHTHTRDLAAKCAAADVVVVAAGHAGTFGARCARPGQVVVDVGINWDEVAQHLVGDVDFDAVEPIVGAITPVPGGVGSVTTACLAKHVVEAAERTVG